MEEWIYPKVVEILLKYSKGKLVADQVTLDTHLLLDLNINSARLVDIVLEFEDQFGIQIQDDETDEIYTVGRAVNLIHANLNKKV